MILHDMIWDDVTKWIWRLQYTELSLSISLFRITSLSCNNNSWHKLFVTFFVFLIMEIRCMRIGYFSLHNIRTRNYAETSTGSAAIWFWDMSQILFIFHHFFFIIGVVSSFNSAIVWLCNNTITCLTSDFNSVSRESNKHLSSILMTVFCIEYFHFFQRFAFKVRWSLYVHSITFGCVAWQFIAIPVRGKST